MILTKKKIINAVSESSGVSAENIELTKFEGTYHWSGKAGAMFLQTNTEIRNLKDYPLEKWKESFDEFKKETLKCSRFKSLNEMIESIDWTIE